MLEQLLQVPRCQPDMRMLRHDIKTLKVLTLTSQLTLLIWSHSGAQANKFVNNRLH